MTPKLWYSRGYLPHFDAPEQIQAITFRLADSLPDSVVSGWRRELATSSSKDEAILRQRIARWEDAGHGSCLLARPEHASVMENTLLHFDGSRYCLLEWCVMPNHVHVLVEPGEGQRLDRIVKSWKSFSDRVINEQSGHSGRLWARDYHDRYIRDLGHLEDCRGYIRKYPVKAGLCEREEEWRFGSTWAGRDRRSLDRHEWSFGPV
jgi:putative transposase